MHSFIEDVTFLRRSSGSTQPLSFSNLKKFNASPPTEGSQSLFDLLPAVKQLRNEQEAERPQRWDQDGPKLWLSPHSADCFLVVPPSTVHSHTPASASRSNTPEQQAASSPMAISNLVRRDSSPFFHSPPQSIKSSRKRSREESQDTAASSPPRPLASHDGAASSLDAVALVEGRSLTESRLVATPHSQPADANERAKRRRSLGYTSDPQRTLSGPSVAPSDRPLPSGSFSTGFSANSSRRGDVRVYRVHKSIIAQCGLLRDVLERHPSPLLAVQDSEVSTSESGRHSRSPEDLRSHAQKLAWPLSLVTSNPEMMLPLVHRKRYLPSKRFSGLALPTLLPNSGGGGAAPHSGHSRPVSPTTPCVAPPSALAGSSSRSAGSQGRDAAGLTTVHMPVPDGETMPLLLHYLYHHALSHLAKALNRQATSCATAAAAAAEGRCADADADWEAGREEHYRRLIGGLIANFDYLGVEEREPREWLAGEWKRFSASTSTSTSTSTRSGGVAAGGERRTLGPLT